MEESVWGAQTFLNSLRRRLHTRKVGDSTDLRATIPPRELASGRFPTSWNILLLGARGSGKSSLVYTFWRSLNSVPHNDVELAKSIDHTALEHLSLPWNYLDFGDHAFELEVEALEDPTAVMLGASDQICTSKLVSINVQKMSEDCDSIVLIDTPGLSVIDEAELGYLKQCITGQLYDGASVEAPHSGGLPAWLPPLPATADPLGLFQAAYQRSDPHVAALVIDMSTASFQDLLDVDLYTDVDWAAKYPQLVAYHKMIDEAHHQGLQVFVILTFLDIYKKTPREINGGIDVPEGDKATALYEGTLDSEGRLGEDILVELKGIYLRLSQSLSFGGRDMPPDRIFVVENYRNSKRHSESRLELAAAEILEVLLDSADNYILSRYKEAEAKCAIS